MRQALEEREQVAVFATLGRLAADDPRFDLAFHPPNGGARLPITGAKLKAAGVKRGIPDILVPYRTPDAVGLAIEMKTGHGKLTPEQAERLERFVEQGWSIRVCRSAGEAVRAIVEHIGARVPEARLRVLTESGGGVW